MNWEVVIGLEIHAQLATKSKIFSGASTAYGAEPNTQACLVDLGYPGVLPVLNGEVVHMAAMFGLAVNATVAPRSVFARTTFTRTCQRGTRSASTSCRSWSTASYSSPTPMVTTSALELRAPTSRKMPASRSTKVSTSRQVST